MNSQPNLDI